MPRLFLKFTDETGSRRVEVPDGKFVVGRHTANDLSISNPKLSREHIEITRSGDSYYVEDLGSSNGTTLNTYRVRQAEALYNGDILNLGGGVEITVSIDHSGGTGESDPEFHADPVDSKKDDHASAVLTPPQKPAAEGFEFGRFFLLAPLLLLFVLIFAGGAVLLFKGTEPAVVRENSEDDYELPSRDRDTDSGNDEPSGEKTPETEPTASSSPTDITSTGSNTEGTDIPLPEGNTGGTQSGGANSVEKAAIGFMRRIARNDPSPVLTSRQASEIQAKIDQIKNSSALAANIRNAKANNTAIASLAGSKNLKPQFLATAAITKLGNNSGNVLTTAQGMIEVLDKLNIQIGDEVADDGLITIAAYQQGVSDQFLKMRNTMEKLATENPNVSSRQIRTIWFLRDKGKVTSSEFEFALRFLAIGTITQNPKMFGVNAEELSL
ncbi:MAG: FHA domain-containing protein [Pyrinomonadaceae bacterium]